MFGLAPVNGFHLEGVSQDEGNALFRAEVGEPVPGEGRPPLSEIELQIGKTGETYENRNA
jgi:hypothetical protein